MNKIITGIFAFALLCVSQSCLAFENIIIEDVAPVQSKEISEAKTMTASVTFDWLDISQAQRDEQIDKYKNLLFNSAQGDKVYYTKDAFKKEFEPYKKDREYKHHYMSVNNGVTEDEEAKYCAFYYKKNTLVIYAIQYKKNPHNAFYYTAFGKLYYVDVTSSDYPNFPYYSMQYNRKGKLKSAIYFVSKDIQYMFGPDQEFQGIWYKDKMYDVNGKQTLTRSNW